MEKTVYDYITTEENAWKTTPIPLTDSKDWSMYEHIQRCFNVANGWFHSGKNDGVRPYDDIATPIIDLAFRLEGFNVKDIVPFIDNAKQHYKSFLVKKYHPDWATKNQLDTFIDEVVESSIIYDLALIKKNTKQARPELVSLQKIAFCDQTDVLSGPLCLKHQYTISDLLEMSGVWNKDKIDEAIVLSKQSKPNNTVGGKEAKTSGKYIEIYELHGMLPEIWLNDTGSSDKYVNQMHIICYYIDQKGDKKGLTLYKGKDNKLSDVFKALKIDTIRSFGRACGRSIVERLFEPVVWNNYSGIRIKEMLDTAAMMLAQTSSDEIRNQKLDGVKGLTVIKTEDGKPVTRLDTYTGQNMSEFMNHKAGMEKSARMLGSASEGQLGVNPSSGTPFALESLVVEQGEGMHEYRRGKISTFFADILYPEWILKFLVDDMNNGKEFSSDLSLEEMTEVADAMVENKVEKIIIDKLMKEGKPTTEEERVAMKDAMREKFMKSGPKQFLEIVKNEIKDIPVKVKMNIAGKQKYLSQNADKLSRLISNIMANPQAFAMIPGLGKAYNQLIESSGMNPIDFSSIIRGVQESPDVKTKKVDSPVPKNELKEEVL